MEVPDHLKWRVPDPKKYMRITYQWATDLWEDDTNILSYLVARRRLARLRVT